MDGLTDSLFEGKVALVTGGGSGIGRETALTFARRGAHVVIADVNAAGGAETLRQIAAAGGEAAFVLTDVSQGHQVEAMVQLAVTRFGRLDMAFNNAGIEGKVGTSTIDYSEEDWDRVIQVDLKGVWLCMKYEITQMLRQGSGAIVNTSSIAGLVGLTGSSPYVASKHGVIGLTKTAALEYAQQGIRVNAVCPGVVRTPLVERIIGDVEGREQQYMEAQPIGRMGAPLEIAEAVLWLCSDAASFVTGHALSVDGGYVAH
jgi:NAD(P)-dependent dehydrogenase (short-subunit alcohol dehydrogenase family)